MGDWDVAVCMEVVNGGRGVDEKGYCSIIDITT